MLLDHDLATMDVRCETFLFMASRAQLVAAVAAVDYVVICDQPETERLVAAVPPEAVVDLEAQVGRDVVADVLERHPPA